MIDKPYTAQGDWNMLKPDGSVLMFQGSFERDQILKLLNEAYSAGQASRSEQGMVLTDEVIGQTSAKFADQFDVGFMALGPKARCCRLIAEAIEHLRNKGYLSPRSEEVGEDEIAKVRATLEKLLIMMTETADEFERRYYPNAGPVSIIQDINDALSAIKGPKQGQKEGLGDAASGPGSPLVSSPAEKDTAAIPIAPPHTAEWPYMSKWIRAYVAKMDKHKPTDDAPGDDDCMRQARADLRGTMAACGWDIYGGSEEVLPMNYAWEEGFLHARATSLQANVNSAKTQAP